MMLPDALTDILLQDVRGAMSEEDSILVCGPVGLSATIASMSLNRDLLRMRFSERFLQEERLKEALEASFRYVEKIQMLFEKEKESSITCFVPMGEGGFTAALWKMAEASSMGLSVDLRKVPVLQHTIEVAEITGEDPYQADSRGSCIIASHHPDAAFYFRENYGLEAVPTGHALQSRERLLTSGPIIRHLDRPWALIRKAEESLHASEHRSSGT